MYVYNMYIFRVYIIVVSLANPLLIRRFPRCAGLSRAQVLVDGVFSITALRRFFEPSRLT